MSEFLDFCSNYFVLLLIAGIFFLFGVCGFFIDHSTNILSIEKKKKALREKSMNINEIKKKVKDKNVSLAGVSGGNNNVTNNVNETLDTNVNTNAAANSSVNNANEDLTVPFKLDIH